MAAVTRPLTWSCRRTSNTYGSSSAFMPSGARTQTAAHDFLAFLKQPDSMKLAADFGFAVNRD